jgi:hypothetical protein
VQFGCYPELAKRRREAEERIALRFNLREALGEALDESDPLDESSLLNFRWRGPRAVSVCERSGGVTWGWDTKILDETGGLVAHEPSFGNTTRYRSLARAWLSAVRPLPRGD